LSQDKKRMLKELIKQLHAGASPQEVKERFKQLLESVTPSEISRIEQELVEEGMPREEIQRLCDVHLAVFREHLEKQRTDLPSGHPLNILMEEHKIMLQLAEKLERIADKLHKAGDATHIYDEVHNLQHITEDLKESEAHYLREENVLFPYLEKHGVTEPPSIMWMEHNRIREKKKELYTLIERYDTVDFQLFKRELREIAKTLNSLLSNHFFKENNILFPVAMQVIAKNEWKKIREEFDEVGYCCFTPPHATAPQVERVKEEKTEEPIKAVEALQFETGSLSKEEIEAILDSLPVEITFVDKEDRVKYFNKAEERTFVRTKAIIGRKVQLCHPQKSIHIVNRILEAFKTGEKDVAEFWINLKNRLIHIRYFAVRNKDGEYLGTLEVTQDITEIKKIEGERRLLDWKM